MSTTALNRSSRVDRVIVEARLRLSLMNDAANALELREKAALARRLARDSSGDHTRQYLLAWAYGLEKRADAVHKDSVAAVAEDEIGAARSPAE